MGFIVERYGDFMHMSLLLMEQILELFLMILMGFIIVKAGIVTDEDSKVLSKIVLYLIIPCVIINAFQVNYTPETVHGLLIAFIASVMLQILLLIIVSFMGKPFCLSRDCLYLLLKLRKPDCSDCNFYSWTGMGSIWMCFHECTARLHLDALQEDYQPGGFLRLEKNCLKY